MRIQFKRFKGVLWAVSLISVATFGVSRIGVGAEEYAAKSIIHVAEAITDNWEHLDEHFGHPVNAPETFRIVLLPRDGRLLDLMVQGEDVVIDKWKLEYSNIGLSDIKSMLHIHQSENAVSYVVGGALLSGIDKTPSGQVGIFYSNVPFAVVKRIEKQIDKTADPIVNMDGSGRVHYVKRQNNSLYEIGIYDSPRTLD